MLSSSNYSLWNFIKIHQRIRNVEKCLGDRPIYYMFPCNHYLCYLKSAHLKLKRKTRSDFNGINTIEFKINNTLAWKMRSYNNIFYFYSRGDCLEFRLGTEDLRGFPSRSGRVS